MFFADYAKPTGFYYEAWKAIYQCVFAFWRDAGKGLSYYGQWIRCPGVGKYILKWLERKNVDRPHVDFCGMVFG